MKIIKKFKQLEPYIQKGLSRLILIDNGKYTYQWLVVTFRMIRIYVDKLCLEHAHKDRDP